jgi:hypothetical protein
VYHFSEGLKQTSYGLSNIGNPRCPFIRLSGLLGGLQAWLPAFRARVLADDLRWLGKLPRANQFIMPRATLSYGGLKMSGTGKENTLESMLDHFTSSKTVIINPGNPRT